MTLPSKELLSEVLRYEVTNASLDDTQQTPYINVYINNELLIYEDINIYEFAFKCKEWAFDKGYTLTSGNNHLIFMSCSIRRTLTDDDWTDFYSDTEPEAIFKACEWIMEQTKCGS